MKTFYIDLDLRYEVEAETEEEALQKMQNEEGGYPNNAKNGPNGIWLKICREEVGLLSEEDECEEEEGN